MVTLGKYYLLGKDQTIVSMPYGQLQSALTRAAGHECVVAVVQVVAAIETPKPKWETL